MEKMFSTCYLEGLLKNPQVSNENKAEIKKRIDGLSLLKIGKKEKSEHSYPDDDIEEFNQKINRYNTISTIIIAYNEERSIGKCLKSVLGVSDEIIVVDSGSDDKTKEIVSEFAHENPKKLIKTYTYTWEDDFSSIRNYARKKATMDWIIFIDADEELQEGQDYKVKLLLSYCYAHYNLNTVFSPTIIENTMKIYGVNRIFCNYSRLYYKGFIHEELEEHSDNYNSAITLDIIFLHDGYSEEIVNKKNKILRNYRILCKQIEIEPSNPKWTYYLSRDCKKIIKTEEIIKEIYSVLFRNDEKKGVDHDDLIITKYTTRLLKELVALLIESKELVEANRISSLILDVDDEDSDGLYYYILTKIMQMKSQYLNFIQAIQFFTDKNCNGIYKSEFSSEGKHLEMLLAMLYFESGNFDLSLTKFHELENNYNHNIVKMYLKMFSDLK